MSKFFRFVAVGAAVASFGIAAGAQAATTDSANVSATILTALSVNVDATANKLDFASIADGGITTDQNIVLSTAGTLTCASNLICQGTPAVPTFHVSGLAGKTVMVSFVNPTETLSYVGTPPSGFIAAMNAGSFNTDAAYSAVTNQLLLTGGSADFKVGGTLTVHPNMAPGVYTGTVTVAVAYN
jgi:hypothetical protein